jgi:hypothetical protein
MRVVFGIGVVGILVMVAVASSPAATAAPNDRAASARWGEARRALPVEGGRESPPLIDATPVGAVPKSCVFKGKKLYGKVQIVNAFPDFKVQKVTAFPDLKVQEVNAFPDKCGKWQFVTAFPDFKIQYVTAFPDFKVQFVNAFPGVP